MNAPCHRCKKLVYPVDKLICLDKHWHKGCFKCETCGMTLSMKTYKGYNKLPYCNTHYPKTSFTAVADTPENLRLKKNTKVQSNNVYHSEFEKEKGKYTVVADDPETLRQKKTQRQASDLQYQAAKYREQNLHKRNHGKVSAGQPPPPEELHLPAAEIQVSSIETRQPEAPKCAGTTTYIAIYDYSAADDDEVSFMEGDTITDGATIDDGWMTGTVERTGNTGMLPSNYVEICTR